VDKTFAKALTYYLSLRGKTQQDLINDMHYSSSTVSQWCTGKNIPRMDRIEAVATYLGVDKTDLLKDPAIFSKERFTTDPALISKLLESKPALYELFKLSITLSDKDLKLLTGIAHRINELQETEP
jgi:transcriptional regulator with XRE-family HTH domain